MANEDDRALMHSPMTCPPSLYCCPKDLKSGHETWTYKPHFGIPRDGDTRTKSLLVRNHFLEFKNEAWPSLDQLNGVCGAPPTFHLAPLSFKYSARQMYILSFGGDCTSNSIPIWHTYSCFSFGHNLIGQQSLKNSYKAKHADPKLKPNQNIPILPIGPSLFANQASTGVLNLLSAD